MTDGFLATVVTFNPATDHAEILPLITELDGTPHPQIEARAVAGITPEPGDTVLVITIRNNLDSVLPVSRYFDASESNGRIVAVVIPASGQRILTGNYKFVGGLELEGDLTVTGNVTITGNVTVTGDADITGDISLTGSLDVTGDTSMTGNLDVTGSATISVDAVIGGISFITHTHISSSPGNPTGPPQ